MTLSELKTKRIDKSELELGADNAPEDEESERETSDEKRGIFIRLSPDAKGILAEAKGSAKEMLQEGVAGPKTYAGVIEKLLQYYRNQEEGFRKKILAGDIANPLKRAEDVLARLHRAQHAFETKRFYFAIKTYNAVARELKGIDASEELLDVCHFRLAHCWNQLSNNLRTEALSNDIRLKDLQPQSAKFYNQALECLTISLKYLKKLKNDRDAFMAQIKNYNMACCYSLMAQYIVESKLDPDDPRGDWRTALMDARKDPKKTAELWLSIGMIWPELDADDGAANEAAKRAFDWLGNIASKNTGKPDQPKAEVDRKISPESIWIVETAGEDSDFLFFHSAKGWKPQFDKWATGALSGASLATAIEGLLREEHLE